MQAGFGLKAATVTPEDAGDVGSPNALLREAIDGKVIIRTGRRLSGVRPIGGIHAPISIVRMAVDDAYNAREYREGTGRRRDRLAGRADLAPHLPRGGRVRLPAGAAHARARSSAAPSGPCRPVYEGMLKEELDAAAERHPDVRYQPMLIDALYAALISHTGDALVVPALNRDGDCLSDMVLPALRLDRRRRVAAAGLRRRLPRRGGDGRGAARHRADPAGQERRQPARDDPRRRVAVLRYMRATAPTPPGGLAGDLRGRARGDRRRRPHRRPRRRGRHDEFTDEVIKRVRTKLDVWSALGSPA